LKYIISQELIFDLKLSEHQVNDAVVDEEVEKLFSSIDTNDTKKKEILLAK
jgi:hypothetical protein